MKSSFHYSYFLYMHFPLCPISFVKNLISSAERKLIKYFDLRPPLLCKAYALLFICIVYKYLEMSRIASPKNKLFYLHH